MDWFKLVDFNVNTKSLFIINFEEFLLKIFKIDFLSAKEVAENRNKKITSFLKQMKPIYNKGITVIV